MNFGADGQARRQAQAQAPAAGSAGSAPAASSAPADDADDALRLGHCGRGLALGAQDCGYGAMGRGD